MINPKKQGNLTDKEISFTVLRDDRFHSWPDFMNKHDPDWRNASNPFKELALEWKQPGGGLITWETRPESWESGYTSPIPGTGKANRLR